jgi:hypothetical protein
MKETLQKSTVMIAAVSLLFIAGWVTMAARQRRGAEQIAVLASGRFHQVAHRGSGLATIVQYPNGQRLLNLTGFRTGEGSHLEVCLVAAADAFDNETVEFAGFIPLGNLKTIEGDQSYAVPHSIDLRRYRAVAIWNRKYRVNFMTAPLSPPAKD